MADVDSTRTIGDYFALLHRRKIYLVTVIPAAVLLSICLAFGLPAYYRSTAVILIEESNVASTMVPTAVTNTAPDVQIELVRRRAMSPEALKALVAKINPYPDEKGATPGEIARLISEDTSVEKVDPITFKPLVNGSAFSVYYDNPNPAVSARVASEIAKIFLEYNRKTRIESAEQTYRFLLDKSKAIEVSMRESEQKIADFKKRYGAALPEDQLRNQSAVDRSQIALDDLDARIRIADQRVSDLNLQLSQTSPTLVGSVLDTRTEIATLKASLADAEQRYKPDHPDVKRLRRALEELVARRGDTTANSKPDNPDYIRAASALQSARQDLSALRVIQSRAMAERQTLQSQLAIAPSVEKDYTQLVRNRDLLKDQFQQMQGKLQEAEIGKSYENEQQGEKFTLIRAPTVPDSPFSPNRLGLILIGFVLGGALALGLAVMAENADPTVRSYRDVTELTQIPLLGAVPLLMNTADRKHAQRRLFTGVAVFVVALLVTGLVVVRSEHIASVAMETVPTKSESK